MSTANAKKLNSQKKNQTWHLVTNHLNLLYMLAAGLVMEPNGFRGKHYIDPLGAIPGWIPLFRDTISTKSLEQAVSERSHLRPCIVSIDLSGVSGAIQVLSQEGKLRNAKFPNFRQAKEEYGILVQTPLPITLCSCIYFSSDEDRQEFERVAKDVSNVNLGPYRLDVDSALFNNANDAIWPPIQKNRQKESASPQQELLDEPHQIENSHAYVQALGGLLSMLYHSANRSQLGVDIFQLITASTPPTSNIIIHDPVLAELPNWLNEGVISPSANTPTKLYWGVINALIQAQAQNNTSQPMDDVLEYLDTELNALTDEKSKHRLEQLIADMKGFSGLGGGTITELFERNKGSLSRPLLLLCQHTDCLGLLEFSHPLLSDTEYLLAGILFGVRDGWLKLPCEMRNAVLSNYVTCYMASIAHQQHKTTLSLPKAPSPQPLRALFPSNAESWSQSQTNAAIELARSYQWQDSIETVIAAAKHTILEEPKLQHGNYIFSGEVTLTINIRHDVFLKHLGAWPPIDAKQELKIRNDLEHSTVQEIHQV